MRKVFTPAEVDALIPALEESFEEIFRLKRQAEEKHQTVHRLEEAGRDPSGGRPRSHRLPDAATVDHAIARATLEYLVSRIQALIRRIHNLGGLVKDLDLGLVDFPCRHDRKIVYLCWKYGEKKVRYWHGVREGFSARRPVEELTGPKEAEQWK